jgi:hypothetical protein
MVVKLSAPTLPDVEDTLDESEAAAADAELETAAGAGGSEEVSDEAEG